MLRSRTGGNDEPMTRFDDVPSILAELTLEEKASLVSGAGFWWTRRVERLGIPSLMVSDGPHGLRRQDAASDHLGLGGSRPATCFPTAAALASSWDVDLVHRVGVALGEEARAQGVGVVLGPGINIKRTPLCGRNFEYLSEDPVLSGELGGAMVLGIQSQGVGTSLKHYAVNNQETDRLRVSADVDERPLREIYLAGFERVVRSTQPWTVMCSYNRINGVYASQDPWLLTEVLRVEWGFDGLVVSDWGAVDDPVAAVAAGLDLEMPSTGGVSARRIVEEVKAGGLDEAVLDTAIGRLLQLLERALPGVEGGGDEDHSGAEPPGEATRQAQSPAAKPQPAPAGPVSDAQDLHRSHHALARAAAAECAVLLKNAGGLLPLTFGDGDRLAVIGELARTPRYQGAGSSKVNPTRVDDALSALRAAVDNVDFAAGYGVDDPDADTDALLAEAVDIARSVGTVVVFLGLPPSAESEGFDRTDIDLPADQLAVLDAVAAVSDRVVVVLANGSVVATSGWDHHAGAVVEGWLGGQAGGSAIVDVLLGTVNPSGRLAETIPLRLEDTPAHLNFPGEDRHVRYGEGLHVGYRHYDAVDDDVAYPFGHGLSYTTFGYTDLTVTALDRNATGDWRGAAAVAVEVTVTNTGAVAGKEVVQVYVGDPEASVSRPVRELKAFAKVALEPGESTTATLTLTERDLSYWSTRAHGWVLEPGTFEIAVGASSRDLRASSAVEVDGPPPALPLDAGSTLGEWLDHPVGHDLLLDALRANPEDDLTPMLEDASRNRMLRSFPLGRLAAMLGTDLADGLLAEVQGSGD